MSDPWATEVRRRRDRVRWVMAGGVDREVQEWDFCRRNFLWYVRHYGWLQAPHDHTVSPTRRVVPFLMWPSQIRLWKFWRHWASQGKSSMTPKSRELGVTWLALWWGSWRMTFEPGFSMLVSSRNEYYVDRRGSPVALFSKLRWIQQMMPHYLKIEGLIDTHMVLSNPGMGSSITGSPTGEHVGRGDRQSLILLDEVAAVQPSIMAATIPALASVGPILYVFNPGDKASPIYRMQLEVDPARVMVCPWTFNPTRPDNFQELMTRPQGDLTKAQFAEEFLNEWGADRTGCIFDVQRQITQYDESEPGLGELRERWRLHGAWDYGSGASRLACPMGLLEMSQPPRIWVEYSLEWQRTRWQDASIEVLAIMRKYKKKGKHIGDPTGDAAESDQMSWRLNLRSTGIPVEPLTQIFAEGKGESFYVNSREWRMWAISRTQVWLDNGWLRVHARCHELWDTLEQWAWSVPEGKTPDEVDRIHIRPKADGVSHTGMALLYLVTGLEDMLYQERMANRVAAAEQRSEDHRGGMGSVIDSEYGAR